MSVSHTKAKEFRQKFSNLLQPYIERIRTDNFTPTYIYCQITIEKVCKNLEQVDTLLCDNNLGLSEEFTLNMLKDTIRTLTTDIKELHDLYECGRSEEEKERFVNASHRIHTKIATVWCGVSGSNIDPCPVPDPIKINPRLLLKRILICILLLSILIPVAYVSTSENFNNATVQYAEVNVMPQSGLEGLEEISITIEFSDELKPGLQKISYILYEFKDGVTQHQIESKGSFYTFFSPLLPMLKKQTFKFKYKFEFTCNMVIYINDELFNPYHMSIR